MKKNILVTGGAGYIGSHACCEILKEGYGIVVVDNLSVGNLEAVKRVQKITNQKINFKKLDLRDEKSLDNVFRENKFYAVMHFAGLKAVGESVFKPLEYYDNNLIGTLVLLRLMKRYGVSNIIFSSSACVYGDAGDKPIKENFPLKPESPYGHTKAMIEQILKDIAGSDEKFNAIILRYFNPVGAHESGTIGEDPKGIPNNLVPYISQVAVGKLKKLNIFGNDYPTPDGTGIRDYIHIKDLIMGHTKSLELLRKNPGLRIYNLGTGRGYSVLEVIRAFEKASGKKIPFKFVPRRSGDVATVTTDPGLANKELKWHANYDIEKMCEDVWRWKTKNPHGYSS